MAGNPLTDKTGDINSRLEYAYHMALISEELYEVKESFHSIKVPYVFFNS